MEPPALRVALLGELSLHLGATPLAPLESARAESLLAYLLLHRDAAQPRARIAGLLWPDSSEAQARTNLRHVLHTLRHALPEAERCLEVTARTLRWTGPVELDVAAFEGALALGDGEAAVAVYAGDLLEGSDDAWVRDERERLKGLYLAALEQLATAGGPGAVDYAERLVRADPLREQSYRVLMRLHDARGEPIGALRAYHACAATLERDLGVAPSAATRAAYEALMRAPAAAADSDGAGHAHGGD
ncbi:MAG TPA: BTAD domain-containing putative transcriptional regulator, partial [Solirubrobacteraceae bacterium]|nr:BTAD domain-containing putative transcriptional regulator [Solirubrobacteraceae bacterium]